MKTVTPILPYSHTVILSVMPELPDVEVFAKNLNKVFANKKLLKVKVVNGKKLPDTAKALSTALEGKTLKRIYRSGKEFRFAFSEDTMLGLHLMLTGDLFLFEGKNEHHSTIVRTLFRGQNQPRPNRSYAECMDQTGSGGPDR